ncbi:hypothetical protein V5N11_009998 [Cardamine amara subsp. amara]|uniref:Reverse transcriptase zinc-binding domain-containing protein n=1 Tax=Cardamine amara subsp. amara TaxID=228776 RepID=A0ABD1B4C3_CARAN
MNISPLCCLCNQHLETREHIFLHCEYSEQLWSMLLRRLGQHQFIFQDWNSLISWLSTASHDIPMKLKLLVCHTTIYTIWRERNDRLFNSQFISPPALFSLLDRAIKDILLARRLRHGCSRLLASWFAFS